MGDDAKSKSAVNRFIFNTNIVCVMTNHFYFSVVSVEINAVRILIDQNLLERQLKLCRGRRIIPILLLGIK